MRHDPPYGHLRDEPTQCVELCGALFPVEHPVHVRILDKTEKRLARTHCFDPRRIGLFNARSEEVHRPQNSRLPLEFCIPTIQRQKELLPTRCQPWQTVPPTKQFLYSVRP